jgi:hypothetical protein
MHNPNPHNLTLLDWGVRSFVKGGGQDLNRKLIRLLEMFHPTIILLSGIRPRGQHNVHLVGAPMRAIEEQAASLSIPTKSFSKIHLRTHFGHRNKHEVAKAIATRFPELAWHLPRKRKPWQTEPASQVVFDAAALGLQYFATWRRSGGGSKREALWSAPGDE